LSEYRERWIVERTVGWLGNYRGSVVRYERKVEMYRAFVVIAFILICLCAFLK
jgi:transposase